MIRAARPADQAAVEALQSHLDAPAPDLLDAAFAGVGDLLVAVDDGVVGYALAVPGDPEADPSVVYLAELVVSPEARRQGWGSALVEAVRERADGYDELRVTARADADAALAFYRARGFREAATLPGEFERDAGADDGVLLVDDLA
ncbi:GNAT family N-acetyltransferase [Halorarius halobius]|uniref:GNAT family N-acetyltransferase n=1 Tax=Halorarius halobius TaxID=2962671 RepID=UPI0020CE80DA|nr:GNAT family N-acetyltransferase [Halorarius halobius]